MSTPVAPHPDRRPLLDAGGFTDAQFRELVHLVRSLPGRWFVERREDDLGAVSVLLVPNRDGADDGPSFALCRWPHGIVLDLRRDGRPEFLGGFGTLRQAVDHVSRLVGQTGPAPAAGRR